MGCLPKITEEVEIIEKSCVNLERKLLTLVDNESAIVQQQARDLALEAVIILKGHVLALGRMFK